MLRILRDPPRLAALVDVALASPAEPSEALRHVIVETQNAGAEALVAGRQQNARAMNPRTRLRFVTLMRDIGGGALAVTRAELSECLARGERTGAFVEDLLRSVPAIADEATGNVVAAFLEGATAATTAAALTALGSLWGNRAHPLMLGALGTSDDGVRLAAISALRAMRGIDALVVRHAEPILGGVQPASDELRIAVAVSLGEAAPSARPGAAALLMSAFSRAASRASTPASAALVVALARSLLIAGVPNATATIAAHLETSDSEVLRRQLSALLGQG